ncbi:MAG: GFA family protein [Hyphomicrobiales bacterium]
MTKKHSASCKCGKVSFEVELVKHNVGLCHCSDCQKTTSSHFASLHYPNPIEFNGAEYITVFDSSDWAKRAFCSVCGSTLYYRYKGDKGYSLAAGLFDDQSDFVLKRQLFSDKRPSYIEFVNKADDMTEAEVRAKYDF